jgi:uncharacterized protein YkwD
MRAQNPPKRARLDLEALENRIVPTSATLNNGVLTVLGDMSNVSIQIGQSNGQISVSGVSQSFTSSQVKMISVEAGDGNNTITIAPSVTAETWIFAGQGNNYIQGGGGKNHIFGGAGSETIVGGSAQDVIFPGTGQNSITAPAGAQVYNGPAYQSATIAAIGQQIVDYTNQLRAQNGLPPLTVSGQLTAAAQIGANNEAATNMMSHLLYGVPEPSVEARAEEVGYNYSALGENLTTGAPDVNAVMQSWINSPAHKANLLNPLYTQIGVAVAYGPNGVGYAVQVFGAPGGAEPSGPPSLRGSGLGSAPVTTAPTNNPPTTTTPVSSTPVTTAPVSSPPVTTAPVNNPPVTTAPVTSAPVTTAPVNNPPVASSPVSSQPLTTTPPSTSGFAGGSSMSGQVYAVGSDAGTQATVTVYDAATGAVRFTVNPYGSFSGGARVAVGDLAGNGVPDVIVSPGPGMAPEVKVYNSTTGQLTEDFMAYDWRFGGGVYVAAGDVKGAGHDDIITGADAGGGPHVKVFDGTTQNLLFSFFAFDAVFTGGVRVAAGNTSGNGYADIITGAGPGGGPDVRVFDGLSGARVDDFYAYDANFTGGVYVAAGDTQGTGRANIITGAGAGGGPNVRVFDGVSLAVLANFMAADPNYTGGVRVGAFTNASRTAADIMTSFGNADPAVDLFGNSGNLLTSFLASDPNNAGLYIG